MADINLQLTREFFELHLFRVLTNWQRESPHGAEGGSLVQLFVENSQPKPSANPPGHVLSVEDIQGITRAVVEVRAWHADRFYPSVIENNPVLSQFVSEDSLRVTRDIFGTDEFRTILVISELPRSAEPRERSIALLRRAGVDHILEFPVLLRGLLDRISAAGTYGASATLQTIHLLKRYQLVRNVQLELPLRADVAGAGHGHTADVHDIDESENVFVDDEDMQEPEGEEQYDNP